MKDGDEIPRGYFDCIRIPKGIVKSKKLTGNAKLLIGLLLYHCNEEGEAKVPKKILGAELGIGPESLNKNIELLKEQKLIADYQEDEYMPPSFIFLDNQEYYNPE